MFNILFYVRVCLCVCMCVCLFLCVRDSDPLSLLTSFLWEIICPHSLCLQPCYQNSHSGRSDAPPWILKPHFRFLPVSRMTFFVEIPALQHVLTLTALTCRIETVCCATPKLALATSTSSRSWPLSGGDILSHSGPHSSLPDSPPLCSHIM